MALQTGQTFYTGAIPAEERVRQTNHHFPNDVSVRTLASCNLCVGTTFADFGCGNSTAVAEYVTHRGSVYTPIDKDPSAVEKICRDFPHEWVTPGEVLDVTQIGDNPKMCDDRFTFSHTRSVLGHIPEYQREQVIFQICRVTKGAAIFLDFDWSTVNCENPPAYFTEFVSLALKLFKEMRFDPFFGTSSERLIGSAVRKNFPGATLDVHSYLRPNGSYNGEFADVARALSAYAGRNGNVEAQKRLDWIAEQFIVNPVECVTPAMKAVVVYMSPHT